MAFVLLSGYLLQWAESFKGQLARLGLSCQVSSHCQTQASAILSSALSPNPWSQSFFPEFDPWHFSVLSHARSSSPGDLQGNALLGLETRVLLISSWQLLKEWRLTQVAQYIDELLQLSFFDQLQCGQIQDIKMTSRSVSRDSSTPDIGGSCQDVMFHFLTNNQNKLFVSSRLFSQRQPLRALVLYGARLTNQFSSSPQPRPELSCHPQISGPGTHLQTSQTWNKYSFNHQLLF